MRACALAQALSLAGLAGLTRPARAGVRSESLLRDEWAGPSKKTWIATAKRVMAEVLKVDGLKYWFGVVVPNKSWGHELVVSYNTHIHHKDNLVSIQKKLAAGEYAHPVEWENAVRIVFRNAFVFNKRGTEERILEIAEAGSHVFETQLARLKVSSLY